MFVFLKNKQQLIPSGLQSRGSCQPRSQGLSSYRLGRARRDGLSSLALGGKMRDPENEVGKLHSPRQISSPRR